MTQRNKSYLSASIATCINDNTTGQITAGNEIRDNLIDVIDSLLFNSGSQRVL
jgi:hypothetical protein